MCAAWKARETEREWTWKWVAEGGVMGDGRKKGNSILYNTTTSINEAKMDAHDFTVTSVLACRCAFSLRNDLSSLIFEIGWNSKCACVCVCAYALQNKMIKTGNGADKVEWIAPIGANKIVKQIRK